MSGLRISRHAREHVLRGRAVPQPPGPEDARVVAANALNTKLYGGQPFDVILTLEALRSLAEQGNLIAGRLYDRERERLGLGSALFSVPGRSRDD